VKHCLQDDKRREVLLPVLPKINPEVWVILDYLDRSVGTLVVANETRKDILPDEIIEAVSSAIPARFPRSVYPDITGSRLDAFAVMSLALLRLLMEHGRADFVVIFYPPKK